MSVSLYLGLPGDGKSMAGMRKVVDWLCTTDGYVVTNLPIEMGELQSYLRERHGKDVDCLRRVILLGQEQVRKFWLIRGDGWRLIDIEERDYSNNQYPSLQRVYRWRPGVGSPEPCEGLHLAEVEPHLQDGTMEEGDLGTLKLACLYVIDESQNFWPARSFQTTPKGLLFYLSQHRHCGDECVFITQKEAQVEKTVRNLVLEFWVYRNLGQRRRMGFKLPGLFGYACYDQPPSTQGAQFIGCGTFKMDTAGLANCYRTADGVGVGGPSMVADVGRRRGGLSWRWVAVPLVLILLAAYFGPGWLVGGIRSAVMRATGTTPVVMTNSLEARVPAPLFVVTSAPPAEVRPAPVEIKLEVKPERTAAKVREVWTNNPGIVGSFKTADGWFVVLSDGRELSPLDIYRARGGEMGLVGVQLGKDEPWLMWAKKSPAQERAGR